MKGIKEYLDEIREPKREGKFATSIGYTLIVLLIGIVLGIFSKYIESPQLDYDVLNIVNKLGLNNLFSDMGIWILLAVSIAVFSKTPLWASLNVFVFFLGMNVSYHVYTIKFCGFNPSGYMRIWYIITVVTPILAYICWYAKGNGKLSIGICSTILMVMMLFSFSIGWLYFGFLGIVETIMFLVLVGVLYQTPKKSIYSLLCAIILVNVINLLLYL